MYNVEYTFLLHYNLHLEDMNPLEKLKERMRIKPSVENMKNQNINVLIQGDGEPTKMEAVNLSKMTIRDKTKESNFDIRALTQTLQSRNMIKTTRVPTNKRMDEYTKESTLLTPKRLIIAEEIIAPEEMEREGEIGEEVVAAPKEKVVKERRTKKIQKGVSVIQPESWVQFGDTDIIKRLPEKKQKVFYKTSSYYMNNREIFVNFINSLFQPYRDEVLRDTDDITCDSIGNSNSTDVELLAHQKLVRDYLNLYTPYRGLLLFHSLGSGKSLSSIAIAEGMKDAKKVVVLTPASLESNYRIELKKFDPFYRANQCWEWIDTKKMPEVIDTLSSILHLSADYIKSKGGAWLVNVTKPTNCQKTKKTTTATTASKKKGVVAEDGGEGGAMTQTQLDSLNAQIDKMIETKYEFIHYNGLRRDKVRKMTDNFETNIFDNKVIIIDEAHNFISRIVNKINKEKEIEFNRFGKKDRVYMSQSMILYEMLLTAQNCRIVLLTGTPIINYPNEIGVLFNILRGYIKTWEFPLDIKGGQKVSKESLKQLLEREKMMDYMDYSPSTKQLTLTRNPFGFENKIKRESGYHGVSNDSPKGDASVVGAGAGVLVDADFERKIIAILSQNGIDVIKNAIRVDMFKALPDKLDTFSNWFIEEGTVNVKNIEMFKRRIMGMTSYFRSTQEKLLPKYEKVSDFHVLKIPMSDEQFTVYESARAQERKQESSNKKKKGKGKVDENGIFKEPSSTYRIFSRLYCNFIMPKTIGRPLPKQIDVEDESKVEDGVGVEIGVKETVATVDVAKKRATTKKKKLMIVEEEEPDKEEPDKEEPDKEEPDKEEPDKEEPDKEEQKGGMPPSKKRWDLSTIYEEALKNNNKLDKDEEEEVEAEGDEVIDEMGDVTYESRLKMAMEKLKAGGDMYLTPEGLETYSPKYLSVLENIQDPSHLGLHLVYSQFRTLEGIGILKLVLEQNGFAEFKLKRDSNGVWQINIPEEDLGKPTFALYTGTETKEEKELVRKIFNSSWNEIPPSLSAELKKMSPNNNMGEIIKVLMITASGSEGINLRNTRYVHIIEPYWHPARTEQVVGRARRICSHRDLPQALQTVEVFLYLMTFTKKQIQSDESIELKNKDLSKREYDVEIKPGKTEKHKIPLTSDEALYEICTIKDEFSNQLITAIKESSIDCAIYSKRGNKEQLHCLNFGEPSPDAFAYKPTISKDSSDTASKINRKTVEWVGREITIHGKKYILREIDSRRGNLYDFESYKQAVVQPGMEPLLIGSLEKSENGKMIFKNI